MKSQEVLTIVFSLFFALTNILVVNSFEKESKPLTNEYGNQNGFELTLTFTVILTQPLFPVFGYFFYKSCKDMHVLCTQALGLPQLYFYQHLYGRDKEVSSSETIDNAQPGIARLNSIEEENTENSEIIEVPEVHSSETVNSYVDLNSLNEVQVEYTNLTKAWSPMLLTVFTCEMLMLISSGLVLSKHSLLRLDSANTWQRWTYLLCQSGIIIVFICIVAEWTHNRVCDYSHAVRYVFEFLTYRTQF